MPLSAASPTTTDPAVQELKAMVEALATRLEVLQQAMDALPEAVAEELRARLAA